VIFIQAALGCFGVNYEQKSPRDSTETCEA
jgi:hypothetical protein